MDRWVNGRIEGWKNKWKEVGSHISSMKSLWILIRHIALMKYSSQIVHCFYNNKIRLAVNSSERNGY